MRQYLLRTNTALTAAEIVEAYKGLWRVERALRTLKSNLDLRPLRHWSPPRVHGHVMVCFLALVLDTILQRKLREAGVTDAYAELMADLGRLHAVQVDLDGQACTKRSKTRPFGTLT